MPTRLRRLLLGAGSALLLGTTVALEAADPPAKTEQKAKLDFSDSLDGGRGPGVAVPAPLLGRSSNTTPKDRGSLDAVTVPPLQSGSSGASVLSRRDRETLDNRSSWISAPADAMTINEENANRAFGVRPSEFGSKSENWSKQRSAWDSFLKQAGSSASPRRSDPLADSMSRTSSTGDPFQRSSGSSFGLGENPGGGFSSRERSSVVFSDSYPRDALPRVHSDGFGDSQRDLVRDNLNFTAAPKAPSTDNRWDRGADTLRRSPGTEPPLRAPAANSLGGLSPDLINLQPDLTRQQLNPVVAQPAAGLGNVPRFNVSDVGNAVNLGLSSPRRSSLDPVPIRGFAPALPDSELTLSRDRRKSGLAPTVLEMPKRSF